MIDSGDKDTVLSISRQELSFSINEMLDPKYRQHFVQVPGAEHAGRSGVGGWSGRTHRAAGRLSGLSIGDPELP
jgi:hypothetical protein